MANNFTNDTNCKALWSFESSTLLNDSKGSNTLTNSGVVANATTYKEGASSAEFVHASSTNLTCLDANLNAGFPLKSGDANKIISVSCWFYTHDLPAGGTDLYRGLAAKYDIPNNKRSFALRVVWTSGGSKVSIALGYNNGASAQEVQHGTSLSINTWYHVTGTYQDSTKAWTILLRDISGNVVGTDASGTATNNISVNDSPWIVGQITNVNNYAFDGFIDELVVFSDVITSSEATQIAQGTYGQTNALCGLIGNFQIFNRALSATEINQDANGTFNNVPRRILYPFNSVLDNTESTTTFDNTTFDIDYFLAEVGKPYSSTPFSGTRASDIFSIDSKALKKEVGTVCFEFSPTGLSSATLFEWGEVSGDSSKPLLQVTFNGTNTISYKYCVWNGVTKSQDNVLPTNLIPGRWYGICLRWQAPGVNKLDVYDYSLGVVYSNWLTYQVGPNLTFDAYTTANLGSDGSANVANGLFDNLQVFNYPLSDLEVSYRFANPNDPTINSGTTYFCTFNGDLTYGLGIKDPAAAINKGVTTIDGGKLTTGTITAQSGVIASINANVITTGTLEASVVNVVNLNASNITTGTLTASKISGGTLNCSLITVSNLSASSITTGTLNCSLITVSNLSANSITTGTLSASKISGGTLNCSLITVSNLSASSIAAGTLTSSTIQTSVYGSGVDRIAINAGDGGLYGYDGASVLLFAFKTAVYQESRGTTGYIACYTGNDTLECYNHSTGIGLYAYSGGGSTAIYGISYAGGSSAITGYTPAGYNVQGQHAVGVHGAAAYGDGGLFENTTGNYGSAIVLRRTTDSAWYIAPGQYYSPTYAGFYNVVVDVQVIVLEIWASGAWRAGHVNIEGTLYLDPVYTRLHNISGTYGGTVYWTRY